MLDNIACACIGIGLGLIIGGIAMMSQKKEDETEDEVKLQRIREMQVSQWN